MYISLFSSIYEYIHSIKHDTITTSLRIIISGNDFCLHYNYSQNLRLSAISPISCKLGSKDQNPHHHICHRNFPWQIQTWLELSMLGIIPHTRPYMPSQVYAQATAQQSIQKSIFQEWKYRYIRASWKI